MKNYNPILTNYDLSLSNLINEYFKVDNLGRPFFCRKDNANTLVSYIGQAFDLIFGGKVEDTLASQVIYQMFSLKHLYGVEYKNHPINFTMNALNFGMTKGVLDIEKFDLENNTQVILSLSIDLEKLDELFVSHTIIINDKEISVGTNLYPFYQCRDQIKGSYPESTNFYGVQEYIHKALIENIDRAIKFNLDDTKVKSKAVESELQTTANGANN